MLHASKAIMSGRVIGVGEVGTARNENPPASFVLDHAVAHRGAVRAIDVHAIARVSDGQCCRSWVPRTNNLGFGNGCLEKRRRVEAANYFPPIALDTS